jgi:hypothetical protein
MMFWLIEDEMLVMFLETGSVLLKPILFYWNRFCFIETGSVLLKPVLFYWNRFCFIETGSVLLKPVLFWSSEKKVIDGFPRTDAILAKRMSYDAGGI